MNIALTPGNVDDRKPVTELLQGQSGKFLADKGHISKALANTLKDSGIVLITKFLKNMKNRKHEIIGQAIIA